MSGKTNVLRGVFLKPYDYALPLCLTFEELFTGVKVWHKAQMIGVGHKKVYEIDPKYAIK